jgi:protein gp37
VADRTTINYADASWNPVAGCTPVSAGCNHCFAARYAGRHLGAFDDRRPFSVVRYREDQLELPLRWRKPRTILLPTLGDLFHPDVPDEFIDCVFAAMSCCPQHRFLVLTKRIQRLRQWLRENPRRGLWLVPWLWLGVSVEDQASADERIPILLQTPAAHRWVSVEPMLGPVNLREMAHHDDWHVDALDPPDRSRRLEWVVIGGETGPGARACRMTWISALVDQCDQADVPVWVKQWGRNVPDLDPSGESLVQETPW